MPDIEKLAEAYVHWRHRAIQLEEQVTSLQKHNTELVEKIRQKDAAIRKMIERIVYCEGMEIDFRAAKSLWEGLRELGAALGEKEE